MQPPQADLSQGNTLVARAHAENIAYILSECPKRAVHCLEPTDTAESAWVEQVVAAKLAVRPMRIVCTPGYLNDEGQESIKALRIEFLPLLGYESVLHDWRQAD